MVMALLVVMVFMSAMILASVGIAPVVDSGGLSWDSSAYVAHDANRTARYVVEQQEQTERDRHANESLRTIVIVGALAGVLVVAIVQYNRTRRQQQATQLKLQMYLAYLGVNGRVGKLNGQLGVYDHDHGEFVPAGVALLEMRENR